jgi:hypothetical protein
MRLPRSVRTMCATPDAAFGIRCRRQAASGSSASALHRLLLAWQKSAP